MNVLQEIGAIVNFKDNGQSISVMIVAHFQHKAVYVTGSGVSMKAGWGYASSFEELQETAVEQHCPPGNHNYVQIVDAHENSAFCTRCGSTIKI